MQDTSQDPTIQQLFDLTGKTALVSGASGWLGSRFACALAEAGASVVVSSRDASRAKQVAGALPSPVGAPHHGVALDHMDTESCQRGFNDAVDAAGKVDILVNNGLEAKSGPWDTATGDDFTLLQANTTGYFLLARHLHNHIVSRGGEGNVVMLGSMYGQVASYPDAYDFEGGSASPAWYHAHKGGVIHLTRHLAAYWAKDQVRVNCLSPGPFPAPSINKEMARRLCTKCPMNRMGKPFELKGALLLLASDAGSYITGQNITIDGGWMAW